MKSPRTIAIVVGEESGDILAAGLIRALKDIDPDLKFEGVGGPRMIAEGFTSLFPMDRLAVMGLVEPLKRLPELLSIRKQLKLRYLKNQPALFVGVDAPDFNLDLELKLKQSGVKTAHYVSPSVWAWRQGRIKKIARAVDLMLTLFPFEATFYKQHKVAVEFVGHPLADKFPLTPESQSFRENFGVSRNEKLVALLPGSRKSEVEKLLRLFIASAEKLSLSHKNIQFFIPAANEKRLTEIQPIVALYPNLKITLVNGRSHDVMAASDCVVMASGTTTLEAMLLKKPMVIVYKMAWLSYFILSKLVKSKYIGLPNLLAEKALVPELIQADATVNNVVKNVSSFIDSEDRTHALMKEYDRIHLSIKKGASVKAAAAVYKLIVS